MSRSSSQVRRRIVVVLLSQILALVASLVITVVPAVASPSPTASPTTSPSATHGIASVRAENRAITVTGSAAAGAKVDLHVLDSSADEDAWAEEDPVAGVTAGQDGSFTAKVARPKNDNRLYYGKYVAVVDQEIVGTYHYVDDNQVTAKSTFAFPTVLSKKGLQVQMTDDAEELGTQHAGINMAFNELMQVKDEGSDQTITFSSGGRDFYFDKAAVEDRDRQIKPLSDNGQLVNLILLVYSTTDANSAASVLIHPDADPSGGPVFGFNTKTAEGIAYYTAAMEFVTQRYTRTDEKYGRAVGFIVGNEVDAQWTWANMGEKTLPEFLLYYERALRITEMAAQKAYAEARVYTSLTHCWMSVCGTNPDPQTPTRYYQVRDVVDGLNALTKAHGDYGWFLADHPYPENLFDPAFWKDTAATGDVESTPQITFKNIELLPQYLQRSELRYDGQPRRVILSEQGCNTANDSPEAEKLQAACYALAYYKVRFLDGIDSFILHRHVDYKTEGGLRLGLWTWDDDRTDQSAPGRHKISYDVFKYIDTSRSLEVTKFALDVIGIKDWSELVPGWDPTQLAQRPLPTEVGASTTGTPRATSVISSFNRGTDGWRVSDNATAVSARRGELTTSFDAEAKLWRGTDVQLTRPLDLRRTPYLGVKLSVPADTTVGTRYLKVKAYGSTPGVVAEGTARLSDGSGTQQVSLDLSRWAGRSKVTRIKVWVRGSTNADWAGTFAVSDVVRAARLTGTGRTSNIEVTASAPEGDDPGSPVELVVTNHDVRPARTVITVTPCAGVSVKPATLPVRGLALGATRTLTTTIRTWKPSNPKDPRLCVRIPGDRFSVPIEVPAPTATPIFTFDDGTVEGWTAGAQIASVAAVTSFLNGPGGPQQGSHALDATAVPGLATAPKTVSVKPSAPLDLSAAREVVVFVDSYGGVPGATGYQATFTLTSGDDTKTVTTAYTPDAWTELVVPVGDWDGRSSVDGMSVSIQAVGTDFDGWNPHFQIDSLGYYTEART